jgi:hypothetical protein
MTDPSVDELVTDLHDHLRATAELPVPTAESRWLGEAEAVAADAARGDADEAVVAKRVRQVSDLLEHVDEIGVPEADEHVAAARALVGRIESRL